MTGGPKLSARLVTLLAVALLPAPSIAQSAGVPPRIEILEVKNVGISAANDAKSVIEVRWAARFPQGVTVKSFDISLEVSYADKTREKIRGKVSGSITSTRFEVSTLRLSPGRPGAELRGFEAAVTANISETATKQGGL